MWPSPAAWQEETRSTDAPNRPLHDPLRRTLNVWLSQSKKGRPKYCWPADLGRPFLSQRPHSVGPFADPGLDQAGSLHCSVERCRCSRDFQRGNRGPLLMDFDGPVCSVFAVTRRLALRQNSSRSKQGLTSRCPWKSGTSRIRWGYCGGLANSARRRWSPLLRMRFAGRSYAPSRSRRPHPSDMI